MFQMRNRDTTWQMFTVTARRVARKSETALAVSTTARAPSCSRHTRSSHSCGAPWRTRRSKSKSFVARHTLKPVIWRAEACDTLKMELFVSLGRPEVYFKSSPWELVLAQAQNLLIHNICVRWNKPLICTVYKLLRNGIDWLLRSCGLIALLSWMLRAGPYDNSLGDVQLSPKRRLLWMC